MSKLERIQNLLAGASELPPAQRAAYLDAACQSDAALRTEVESLLQSHDDAGRFLADPTANVHPDSDSAAATRIPNSAATVASPLREGPGTRIGPYKILQLIGEGGFGSVFMAEQEKPVARKVALKIIKLGMDTRQVIARFEAERQALATMDHPNIAKVLDAGATETGRPYFVMEYIKGVPILEYCDTDKLDTKARLGLFSSVCHAIQHAHQKGIIHRDIKPSNVLVTMHDGVPVAKVIDFGIAKATNSELTQKTLFTEHQQMIGTPAYMSPEQAEMSGLDIDTRSDIYSLGVLLYELLTGTTPFDSKSLMEAGLAEMMRIIREVEPHKPSTRLSSLGDTGARTAQQRHAGDIRKLGLILSGDLDWIVMKCLEKDRTRRYETASGLAADIKRHLNDETVTAGAPSAGYRLRKFVKRNRARVIAGGIVAGALVLGVVGTTTGMVWALSEKSKATLAAQSEAAAKVQAQENEKKAIAEAKRAETITEFVTTTLRAGDAAMSGHVGGTVGAGQDMTILAAMDNAIKDIDSGRFKDDPATEARLRATIGTILQSNGRLTEAEPLMREALETLRRVLGEEHPDTLGAINIMGSLLEAQGKLAEAEPYHREALAKARRVLGDEDPDTLVAINNMGSLLQSQGKLAEAEPYYREALDKRRRVLTDDHPNTLASINNMGSLLEAQGKLAEAEPYFREALDKRRRVLTGDHPNTLTSIHNMGSLLWTQDKRAEAEPYFREALEMSRRIFKGDHTAVAHCLNQVANERLARGLAAEAEPYLREALEMYQRIFKGDHPDVAKGLGNLAKALEALGRAAEAEPLFVQALEMQRRLYNGDDKDLATFLNNLAHVRQALGRAGEAEQLYVESLEMRLRLYEGDHPAVAMGLNNLANLYLAQGQFARAEPLFTRSLAIWEKALGPDHPDVLTARGNLAVLYSSQGKLDKSVPLLEEVLKAQEAKLGRQHPDTLNSVLNLGVDYKDAGRLAEAIPLLEEAHRASKQYPQLGVAAGPQLLDAYTKAADPAKPESTARAVVLMQELLAAARGTLPKDSPELAGQLAQFGLTLLTLKAWDEAEPLIREALTIREANAPNDWRTFNTKSMLGAALLGQNKLAGAEPLLLDGYQGMKEREAAIPPQAATRIPEALERLVRLYEAKGNETEAAAWRSKLEAALAEQVKPDTKGGGR